MSNNRRDPPDPQPPAGEPGSSPPIQPRRSTRVSRPVVSRHLNQAYQTPIQPPSNLSRSTRRTTTSARNTPVVPGRPISTIASAARSSANSLNSLQTADYDPDAPFDADTIYVAHTAQPDSQVESSQPHLGSAPQTQPEVGTPLPSQSLTGVVSFTGVPTGPRSTGPSVPGPVEPQIAPAGTQSVPAGTQTVPPGTQSVPAGTQSVPPGTQNLPAGTQNLRPRATISTQAPFDVTGRPIPPTPQVARMLAEMSPASVVKRIYQVGSGWTIESFVPPTPRPTASALQAEDLRMRQLRSSRGLDPGPPLDPAFLRGYQRNFRPPGTVAGSSHQPIVVDDTSTSASASQAQPEVDTPLPTSQSLTGIGPSTDVPATSSAPGSQDPASHAQPEIGAPLPTSQSLTGDGPSTTIPAPPTAPESQGSVRQSPTAQAPVGEFQTEMQELREYLGVGPTSPMPEEWAHYPARFAERRAAQQWAAASADAANQPSAPWISEEGGSACPANWSWRCWSIAMGQRLTRMRIICNRHGITIDTSESLFAELIWQICCDEEEYREFFDLPLTMWIRHPLCISIAHKVHGKSMATGWPRHPSDISERDGSKNNILFETWTSNVAKQDMEKASCDALRDDVKNVKLARPELYNKAVDNTTLRSSNVIFEGLTNDDIEQESLYSTVDVIDEKAEGEHEEGEEGAAQGGEEDMEE